jgi:hypothetical protein
MEATRMTFCKVSCRNIRYCLQILVLHQLETAMSRVSLITTHKQDHVMGRGEGAHYCPNGSRSLIT